MEGTHFVVRRDRLTEHEIVTTPRAPLERGDAELRVDMFGFTANNISYALRGDSMSYWKFFPEPRAGWGRIPAWGFGTVVRSASDAVSVGERYYGYFPMSSHVVVQPKRVDETGFFDSAPHRRYLNAVYPTTPITVHSVRNCPLPVENRRPTGLPAGKSREASV